MSHSRDPLDYLIGDEPIPEELRQDTEFRAAYAEAEADLGVIRRGLAAYAQQTPSAERPEPTARRRPRWAGWTIGLAAAAACLVVIVGLSGTLLNDLFQSSMNRASGTAGEGGAEQAQRDSSGEKKADAPREPVPGAQKPGSESGSRGRLVQCAEQVARGNVWTTTPLGNGRLKVEIKVTRQLVPAGTPETIYVQVEESKEWRTGREVLIVVPKDGTDPTAIWPDTEPERSAAAEDEARRTALDKAECPSR